MHFAVWVPRGLDYGLRVDQFLCSRFWASHQVISLFKLMTMGRRKLGTGITYIIYIIHLLTYCNVHIHRLHMAQHIHRWMSNICMRTASG